jgi:hypothetical protein
MHLAKYLMTSLHSMRVLPKQCPFEKMQEKILFYSRLFENPCSEEKVDETFFICLDNYFLCGYVPVYYNIETKQKELNEKSGVIISNGLDLEKVTEEKLQQMEFP